MASYNHMQHAAGGWNATTNRPHQVSNSLDTLHDMSMENLKGKYQHNDHNKGMPPSQTSAPPNTQTVAVSEGAWTGFMTIPRAVSHDQSDDMASHGNSTQTSPSSVEYTNTPSSSTFAAATTGLKSTRSPLARTPTSVKQHGEGWDLLSPLTHDQSASTTSHSSVGRYDCPDEDANGTAYYSASGILSEKSTDTPRNPTNPMETSAAISLSPSPIRAQFDVENNNTILEQLSEVQEEENSVDHGNEADLLFQSNHSNSNNTDHSQPILAATKDRSFATDNHRTQNIFVSRRNLETSDAISMLRSKSHDGTSSSYTSNQQSLPSTIHQELSRSNSSASLRMQSNNDFALWREKSILDTHSDDGKESLAESSSHPESKESMQQRDDEDFGLSTQLMAPAVPSLQEEEAVADKSLESFHKDPLFEMHELSHMESSQKETKEASHTNKDIRTSTNTSVNLSLGHYLSSCSSDSPKRQELEESVQEPLKEDGTILSDINLSKWSVESPEPKPIHNDADANAEEAADSSSPAKVEGTPRTPQKLNFALNPKEFNSPATTLRKNSLQISLEESTVYAKRIEQLEEELARAQEALKEQREFYDDQAAEMHKFTIPLNPQSPYDPSNNKKYSPGTQQQRLLERNQTLLKEVRFADQTCVELSEQNAALQKQLGDRDRELEGLRRDNQELRKVSSETKTVEGQVEALVKELGQTNEDKRGLERQLHAAYDKLDIQTKEIQNVSDVVDQQRHGLDMQQREIQDLVNQRENLQQRVRELATFQTKYYAILRERDDAARELQNTQAELEDARQQLREASQNASKAKATERQLQEAVDFRDHLVSKNELAEQQIQSLKLQATRLQKELDRALAAEAESKETHSQLVRTASQDSQSQLEETEAEFWRHEAEFAAKVEGDVAKMNEALTTALGKLVVHESDPLAKSTESDARVTGLKASSSLLSHFLKSMNKDVLSPQVIQVLQVILAFTQKHLDVIDRKVEEMTAQFSARILKQQELVKFIRSSIEFESDEQLDSKAPESSKSDGCLDATFAAVTSIPDQRVLGMEEARSDDAENKPTVEDGKHQNDFMNSPARDTILNLSAIEAVNSPYQENSAITFSMDGEEEFGNPPPASQRATPKARPSHLEGVQKEVFREPIDLGTKELGFLRSTISSLLEDFSRHRMALRSFVAIQHSSLKQFGDETYSSASRVSKLVEERNALLSDLTKAQREFNECKEQLRLCDLNLKASERSKERLGSENDALKKDLLEMENRLLGNNKGSNDQWARERPPSRTNSFQERLEASINEQLSSESSSDTSQLRAEFSRRLEVQKREISKLQRELRDSEDAHSSLKLSFAFSNEKLAEASELAERHNFVQEELKQSKQREVELQNEASRLGKEVQRFTELASQANQDQLALRQQLEQTRNRLDKTEDEISVLQEKLEASIAEQQCLQTELNSRQKESEESYVQLLEEAGELRNKVSSLENQLIEAGEIRSKLVEELDGKELTLAALKKQVESDKAHIQHLEDAQQQSNESLDNLKMSFAQTSNKLAETMDQLSSLENMADEKEALEVRLQTANHELSTLRELQKSWSLSQEEVRHELQSTIEKSAALTQELERTRKGLQEKTSSLEERQREYAALEEQSKKASSFQQSLTEEVSRLEQAQLALRESFEQTQLELKEKTAVLDQAEGEVARLKKEASEAESRQQLCEEEINHLKYELQQMSDSHHELKLQFISANEKLASAREQLDDQESLLSEKEDLKKHLEHYKEELRQSRQKLEEVTKKLDMSRENHNSTLVEKQSLEEQLENTEAQAQRIADELLATQQEVEQMNSDQDMLLGEKKTLENRLRETEVEIARNQEELEQSIDTKDKLEKALADKDFLLRGRELDLKESRQQTMELQSQVADLQKAKQSCVSEIEYLRESLEGSEESLNGLKVSYATCNNKLAETANENDDLLHQLSESQNEVDKVKETMSSLQQEHDTLVQKLNEEIASIKLEQEEIQQQWRLSEESKATLNGDLASVKETCEDLKQRLKSSQASEEELVKEIDSVSKTKEDLQAALLSAEERLRDLSQREDQLSNKVSVLTNERESLLDELRESEQRAEQHAQEQEAMRESIEATRQQLDEITSDYGNDLNNVREKLSQTLDECENLREKLGSISQQNADYEAEMNSLRLEKEELEAGHEKLQLAFVSCQDKLANLTEQNSNYEASMKELQAACEAAEGLTEVTEQKLLDCKNELENYKSERDHLLNEMESSKEQEERATREYLEFKAQQERREAQLNRDVEQQQGEKEDILQTRQEELLRLTQELVSLRRDVVHSLALIGGENTNPVTESNQNADVDTELRELQHFTSSLCNAASDLLDKLRAADQEHFQLEEQIGLLRNVEKSLRTALHDEKVVSEELASQLREALSQAEFSQSKVNRLHEALKEARASETDERRKAVWSETAREEARLRYENELHFREDVGDETEARLRQMESETSKLSAKLAQSENELMHCKERLSAAFDNVREKELAMADLEAQRESWEHRCYKLRVYMRKLTVKCEEWETAFEQQSKLLESFKLKGNRPVQRRQQQQHQQNSLERQLPEAQDEELSFGASFQPRQGSNTSPRSILDLNGDPDLDQLGHLASQLQDLTWSST